MGRGSVAWFFTVQGGFCLGQRWMWVFLSPAASLSHFPFFQSFWPIFILRKLKVKTWNFLLRSFVFFFFFNAHSFFSFPVHDSLESWRGERNWEVVLQSLLCLWKTILVFLSRSYGIFQTQPEGQRWGSSEIFPNHAAKEMSRFQISFSQHRQLIGYPLSKPHQAWGAQTLPKLHCFPHKPPHDLTFAFWDDLLYTQE